jgi:hypothetical protein
MHKRKNRMPRKQIIQCGELRQSRIGGNRGWTITMRHDRYEMQRPAHPDGNSDKGEEDYSAPERPLPANSSPHTCYYVPFACGLSTAHTIRRTVFRKYHSEELAWRASAGMAQLL